MSERRTAVVSTLYFIGKGEVGDAFKIAEMLLKDDQDLIHKASGWALRFAGDKDHQRLLSFLDKHAATMPRVTLRYALEHFDQKRRDHYLGLKGKNKRSDPTNHGGELMKSKKSGFNSMDEYIATFPEEVQKRLEAVRATIKAAFPEARERISYQIPAFELNGKNFIGFAAWKAHIAIYPIPAGTEAFQKEVAKYKGQKSTLKFPLDKPLPLKLIAKVAKFRVAENLKSAKRKSKAK